MNNRPSFFAHLHPPTIPSREARFRFTFGLGGLSVLLFLSLCLTGALELFYYIPATADANASLQAITFLVPFGWLVRGLHYWAAQALVTVSILHLSRVALTGAYKPPRRFNWLIGLSLLVFVLLLNFTGYALRWDNQIAWALLVGTNLLKSIPAIGALLYYAVIGGSEIGSETVVRFYGWHIFGLALPAFILIAWHLFRVRRDGGIAHLRELPTSNPNPPDYPTAQPPNHPATPRQRPVVTAEREPPNHRISRNDLVPREALAAIVAIVVLFALALWFPPALGPAADFNALPAQPTAPWFFLWVQELLRLGDPFLMGVLIPFILLALLALIPYAIDRSKAGVAVWLNREGRWAQRITVVILLFVVGLTLRGLAR